MSRLEDRLTRQLASRGVDGAKQMARELLVKRGDANADGTLTAHGKERQSMGKAGRAIDRAVQHSGHSADAYKYNAKTNRATLKR